MVYICFTYTLYVLNMGSKHFALHAIKFVRFTTTVYTKLSWNVKGDYICIIANGLQLNCDEYGLQTWFAPSKKVVVCRLTYSLFVKNTVCHTVCLFWECTRYWSPATWRYKCIECRPFVVNTGWKLDSLQMIIFLYVCSTFSVGELKKRFETWIARNKVNGVHLFHLQLICAKYGLEIFRHTCDKIRSIYNHWVYKIFVERDKRWYLYNCKRLTAELCWIRATNLICTK
jgi:hypothetical protein